MLILLLLILLLVVVQVAVTFVVVVVVVVLLSSLLLLDLVYSPQTGTDLSINFYVRKDLHTDVKRSLSYYK